MKPKDLFPNHTRPRKPYPLVILLVLTLCLVSAGAVIAAFKSGILGGQNLDAIGSRRLSESPPSRVRVEPRQGASQKVDPMALPGSVSREVYLDPLTGKIGAPPPGRQSPDRVLSLAEENALSTSSAGLVQTPLPGPVGGVKVDLQGRFRSQIVAVFDTQSNLSIRCASGAVASKDLTQGSDTHTPSGVTATRATDHGK